MKNADNIAVLFAIATLASSMRAAAQPEDVIVRFEHYTSRSAPVPQSMWTVTVTQSW